MVVSSGFSYEEHTADVKVRATGTDFPSALLSAARACTNLLTPVDRVKPVTSHPVRISANSREKVLYAFLEELVYLLDTKHFVACQGELQENEDGTVVHGTLRGDSIANYERHGDIKAPTKHELSVTSHGGNTVVHFVLDI